MPGRVALLEAAPDAALAVLPGLRIGWDGVPVGRLRPGPELLRPRAEPLDSEFLDGPARERVRVRLQRFVEVLVERDLAPLLRARAAADDEPALRGPLHRLVEAGGVVPGATEALVPPALRGRLKALGVRAGRFALFVPALLKPQAATTRALLWAVRAGAEPPPLPAPGLVSLAAPPADWPPGFAAAMGWVAAGPVLLRLDVAERVAAELAWAARTSAHAVPADLASRLGVRAEALPAVLRALGVRLAPGAALPSDQSGPPSPPMMLSRRRVERAAALRGRPEPVRPGSNGDGPFAALRALHR